ncbi:MAG: hypothetical protein ACU0B9_07330 [Limimaricola soesokkakensis]|uniref:hypothetical protein n=1 Tax=Limimaricola soesokkakensis TaxID=1343159 RepID=UPI0040596714
MALTERTEVDRIEIVGEFRQIQVREATVVERDGVEIAREYSRAVLSPEDDVSGRDELVGAVAGAAWTPAVRDAWANRRRRDAADAGAGAPPAVTPAAPGA